jgi:GNAT superfamily N-acetyltransferase
VATEVRLADARDAEEVARLLVGFRDHLELSWPSANSFLAGVERLMDDRDTDYVLGSVGGVNHGVVQLRYRYGLWRAGGDCLVEDVFVEEAARGAGLGRAMMAFAMERARERGCRRMELDTNERNTAAVALYESLGFRSDANPYGARDLYLRVHLDDGGDA